MRFKLNIDIEDKREAQDIDSEQMALTKDSALITYKVDPSILGGLVVRAGERVVDGSVRSNLQGLASQMR